MSKDDFRAEAHRRAEWYLLELEERLDPAAFALFLRVVGGVDAAVRRREEDVDIAMTPWERELFVTELQDELVTLLGLLGFPPDRITAVAGPRGTDVPGTGAADRAGDSEP
ncbi:hypothetical protein F0L17_08850 [Streptomyces sp. TRM43335]|uniref:Uncharacterized protein n=1 Tax=Streptomyces taklimakanensis TaxID=2569853 RepID=A0A6G2BBF8_9ACTN|nr:hypothetical protein [Streptomyces taklimakanensis]MTE19232.1 hypothetical protein [Streptomyces taklimakanensis]